MMLRIFTALFFLIMSNLTFGRSPAIIGSAATVEETYCSYQKSLVDPGGNKEDFIALFENYFNLGRIEDPVLKEKIFCVLYNFYLIDDAPYATEFRSRMPDVDCY